MSSVSPMSSISLSEIAEAVVYGQPDHRAEIPLVDLVTQVWATIPAECLLSVVEREATETIKGAIAGATFPGTQPGTVVVWPEWAEAVQRFDQAAGPGQTTSVAALRADFDATNAQFEEALALVLLYARGAGQAARLLDAIPVDVEPDGFGGRHDAVTVGRLYESGVAPRGDRLIAFAEQVMHLVEV